MKVAFYKAIRPGYQGLYSHAVRFIDSGNYSHCEVIFSDGLSASASWTDGGVRFKEIVYDPLHWDFIEIPNDLEDSCRKWFESNKGSLYDLKGNIRFVLPFLTDDPNRYFCSEAIAASLGILEPWRLGPNGLWALLLTIYHPSRV